MASDVTVSRAIVFFGEGFGPAQAAGGALVLGAVLALQAPSAPAGSLALRAMALPLKPPILPQLARPRASAA